MSNLLMYAISSIAFYVALTAMRKKNAPTVVLIKRNPNDMRNGYRNDRR